MGYRSIISVFVTQGNTVNDYDIRECREQSAQSSNHAMERTADRCTFHF